MFFGNLLTAFIEVLGVINLYRSILKWKSAIESAYNMDVYIYVWVGYYVCPFEKGDSYWTVHGSIVSLIKKRCRNSNYLGIEIKLKLTREKKMLRKDENILIYVLFKQIHTNSLVHLLLKVKKKMKKKKSLPSRVHHFFFGLTIFDRAKQQNICGK